MNEYTVRKPAITKQIGEGPPYHVVPMPLNSEGKGPEMNKDKIVNVSYEVWDCCNMTVATLGREQKLEAEIERLREALEFLSACSGRYSKGVWDRREGFIGEYARKALETEASDEC